MENKNYYIASKGMVYKRKSDNKIVGKYINLFLHYPQPSRFFLLN